MEGRVEAEFISDVAVFVVGGANVVVVDLARGNFALERRPRFAPSLLIKS
jgi:hypothetical protein